MSITHIVMFAFKPESSSEDVKSVIDAMLALKHNCIHPTSQKPYIVSLVGGKENSLEGFQDGITHVFVTHFESVPDREYYIHEDKAHKAFVQIGSPHFAKLQVVDFTPGVF